MSPQRRVRPEDLRPSSSENHRVKQGHQDLTTPSGSPDPPDVAALEETMVPPLRLSSYLALATALLAILPNLRTTRFLSELMGLCIFALPFILGGYSTGLLGDRNNPLTHAAIESGQSLPMPSSTVLTLGLIGTLVGIFVWLLLKSMLDSRGYSLLRQTISGKDSTERPGKSKTWAFFSSNLVQFALAMGAGMGTAPIILRVGARGLLSGESNLFVTLVIPVTIGMLLYTWIRVMCMYLAAWMTWRPTFIPGALGAAFASPIRGARMFWGSFAVLVPLLSASALAITLCAAGMWATSVNVDMPHLLLHLCLIGTSVFMLQSLIWFDIAVVTSIGHRMGEFTVAHSHEEAVRMRSAALKANLIADEQQTITAAYPGMFRTSHHPTYQPTSFQEIYRAIEAMRPSVAEAPIETPTHVDPQELDTPQAASVEASDPWVAPAFEGGGDALGLARLNAQLLPLTLRTANGQAERRYVGPRS